MYLGAVDILLDEKKRQTTIRVLLRLASSQDHSGGIRIDPQLQNPRADPLWMDGVYFSRRINLEFSIDCRRRSHHWRKRKQAGKTNVLLCIQQPIVYAIPSSIIHLKKESCVRFRTCSSKRTCTFADSTNEILYHKKTLESQAVEKVTLQCKFAKDRSGRSTDTTEANMFQSIDVAREHSSQSLGSARRDPSLTRHGET